ncbi:MAG: metal ABC transporter solute-binding protein, Zn/Mn family, partial [Bacteroidales bacterium]
MRCKIIWLVLLAFAITSCGSRSGTGSSEKIITVTIPPIAWFVEGIAGDDYKVNVLLPPGADHHIWEPLPAQINSLSGSEALIINGKLGFEEAWMERFTQVNPGMNILDLSRNIRLIGSGETPAREEYAFRQRDVVEEDDHAGHAHEADTMEGDDHAGDHHAGGDAEAHLNQGESHESHAHGGPDPHYWMSPSAAMIMAHDIMDFLVELNPGSYEKYEANLAVMTRRIAEVDSLVRDAVAAAPNKTVMIYHPALAYMGRDYGFEQVSFEDEGKSPSPARMKELIDFARAKEIKTIFIQAEYDLRNAQSLSGETGAELIVINPMNRNWPEAVVEVA